MRVQSLRLRDFRNYTDLLLAPGPAMNILVGPNAQGKSNILEAIHLLAITRSLRASRESELVRLGAETAAVSADVQREREPDVELEVSVFQTDKKAIRVNGVRRTRVVDLLGQLNAVSFSSQDLGIVAGDPSLRRRYLNIEISQISPRYCLDLASYKRVLEQRNRLLRDLRERPYRDSGLDAWSEQLVRHGAPMLQKRRFFLERLRPLADEVHRQLTDNRESLEIRYLPSFALPEEDGEAPIAEAFSAEILRVTPEEMRRGVTLTGPQRDDVQFLVDGMDARVYGSQGQKRTVVLALKLAEFRLMEDYVGEPPVMLLDDVMSDLDEARQRQLLGWLHGRAQTFITCTSLRELPRDISEHAARWKVEAGTVTPAPADEDGVLGPPPTRKGAKAKSTPATDPAGTPDTAEASDGA